MDAQVKTLLVVICNHVFDHFFFHRNVTSKKRSFLFFPPHILDALHVKPLKRLYQLLTATGCTDNDDSSCAFLCIFGVFTCPT